MRGQFSLRGKVGPFILVGGRPIYLVPKGSFSWGELTGMNSRLFQLRVRSPQENDPFAPGKSTAADEDERTNLPAQRELTAHGDALADVPLQLAVGCAGQINRCQAGCTDARYRSTMRASCCREKYCQ